MVYYLWNKKKEKSCGAIVYRLLGTDLYILMIQMNLGQWSLVKPRKENWVYDIK